MPATTVVVCLAFDHRAPAEGLQRFKECILSCSFVDRALEVRGTFDLIVQGHCSSISEYTDRMEQLREPIAEFVARLETNFVCKVLDRLTTRSASLWLPCEDGRKRVDSRSIDKIVAEGDYMKVHVADWNCMVHETMERMAAKLEGCGFVRLHRSWLVRADFIDRLIHSEHRWLARLVDGTQVRIAKAHVKEVLHILSGESSTTKDGLATTVQPADDNGAVPERLMHVKH